MCPDRGPWAEIGPCGTGHRWTRENGEPMRARRGSPGRSSGASSPAPGRSLGGDAPAPHPEALGDSRIPAGLSHRRTASWPPAECPGSGGGESCQHLPSHQLMRPRCRSYQPRGRVDRGELAEVTDAAIAATIRPPIVTTGPIPRLAKPQSTAQLRELNERASAESASPPAKMVVANTPFPTGSRRHFQ